MTDAFLHVIYPGVIIASGVLFVAGLASLLIIRMHKPLTWVVSAFWAVTGIEVIVVIGAILTGGIPVVITVGYVLAALALLPLLGISRLGDPEAASDDPNRPVLQPDQMARVDGVAAMIVAIAAAVVAWRLAEIIEAAT